MKTTSVFAQNIAAYNAHKYRFHNNKGGTRSGKTYSIMQLLFLLAYYDPKPTITSVVSETLPHLKRGAIRDFKAIIGGEGLFEDKQWHQTESIYTFPSGSIMEFFGADSAGKVHGAGRDRLFINECQNVKYEIARQLFVRTREAIWLDYNPTHMFWAEEKIIGSGREHTITSTYLDNEYLSPEQVQEIESYKSDTNWWRVYGLGQTGRLEGLIFDFDQVDEMPDIRGRHCYGLDFGYTNDPTALIECLIVGNDIYLDELIYRKGLLNSDIAAAMRDNNVPLRSDEIFADAAEPKSIDEIHKYGFNIKPCIKGSINTQIDTVQTARLHVTKRSVNLIKELRNYTWKKDKNDVPLNVPIDLFNHAIDASRYAIYTATNTIRSKGARASIGSLP